MNRIGTYAFGRADRFTCNSHDQAARQYADLNCRGYVERYEIHTELFENSAFGGTIHQAARDVAVRNLRIERPPLKEGYIKMPVIFKKSTADVLVQNRQKNFNAHVASLAPTIRKLQAEGVRDVAGLAAGLNAEGFRAPSGGPLVYTTMYRILDRAEDLGLADGPRNVSTAASNRVTAQDQEER